MTPHERLYRAFSGQAVDHVPFVPKIWVDLGAALTNIALQEVIESPRLAMQVIIEAGLMVGADGVRQFIFPARKTEPEGEVLYEIDKSGRRVIISQWYVL